MGQQVLTMTDLVELCTLHRITFHCSFFMFMVFESDEFSLKILIVQPEPSPESFQQGGLAL